MSVRVPSSFNLATAVCSYGFFMLAPNRWEKVGWSDFRIGHACVQPLTCGSLQPLGVHGQGRSGEGAFERPLHTLHSGAVHVQVAQPAGSAAALQVTATSPGAALSTEELDDLKQQVWGALFHAHATATMQLPSAGGQSHGVLWHWQVVRMLRLAEPDLEAIDAFRAMHAEARAEGFGHMLRSPTVWEDMVKCITLCNCG